MKVGCVEAEGISFANLLRALVLEDLLLRVYASSYREHLWLGCDSLFEEFSLKQGSEESLLFYYKADEKPIRSRRSMAGNPISPELLQHLFEEAFGRETSRGVVWQLKTCSVAEGASLELRAEYEGMFVPVLVEIKEICGDYQRPQKRIKSLWVFRGQQVEYLRYSAENQVAKDLYEIMERLELIGDMGAYYRIYQTLCTESLSGRCLLEELLLRSKTSPQVLNERRIQTIQSYGTYAYMRKRWIQYTKRQKAKDIPWEEALGVVCALAEPLWLALCRQEVFLDDWMPEIRRFM